MTLSTKSCSLRIAMLCFSHPVDDSRVVYREARILRDAGHEVIMLGRGLHGGFRSRRGESYGIPHVAMPRRAMGNLCKLLVDPFHYILFLIAAIRVSRGRDVLHCHEYQSIPIGILLARLRGQKVVYDCHEFQPESIATIVSKVHSRLYAVAFRLARGMERWAARHSDGVIGGIDILTERLAIDCPNACFMANYPPKTLFRDSALSAKFKRQISNRLDGKTVVLFAGYLGKDRGVVICLEALFLIHEQEPNVHLLLAGDCGDFEYYHRLIKSLGLQERVDITGRFDSNEIGEILKLADIGVFVFQTSTAHYCDMDATKLYLYAAGGLAMVLTDAPVHRRFLAQAGDCGLLVDGGNPHAVAEAFRNLSQDLARTRAMGVIARQAFETKFNVDAVAPRLLGLYSRLSRKVGG